MHQSEEVVKWKDHISIEITAFPFTDVSYVFHAAQIGELLLKFSRLIYSTNVVLLGVQGIAGD